MGGKRLHPNRHKRIVAACPTGKRAYPTRRMAELAARSVQSHRDGGRLYPYKDDNGYCCGQYHLTSLHPRYRYSREKGQ